MSLDFRRILSSEPFRFLIGKDKALFTLHSHVPVGQSEPLLALVNGGMVEAQEGCAWLEDTDEATFVQIGEYLYTGDYTPTEPFDLLDELHVREESIGSHAQMIMKRDILNDDAISAAAEVEVRSEQLPEEPISQASDWGFCRSIKKEKRKYKKGHDPVLWDVDGVPGGPTVEPSRSKRELLWDEFVHSFDSYDQDLRPRQNMEPHEDYSAVFLGHAQLYVFADKYDIQQLAKLSLSKLGHTLAGFNVFNERIDDVVELLQFCYVNTPERAGTKDKLRDLVINQASTVENTVEDFLMLVEDNVANQQGPRASLDVKFDHNNEQVTAPHPCSPPPWSPTEVNTPTEGNTFAELNTPVRVPDSTDVDISDNAKVPYQDRTPGTQCQSSPHIRPTIFASGNKFEGEDALKVQHVQEMMEELPDDLVLEILNAPRVQNLLAKKQEAEQRKVSPSSEQVTITKIEQIVMTLMDSHADKCLDPKIKQAFKSLVRQRLDRLVQDQLPLAADLFLNGAVERLRDQFYEDCKMFEAGILETVEEGRTQLHDTTNECTAEINNLIQERTSELEYKSDKLKISVGEQLACLGYWSDKFARSNGNKEHATKTTARGNESLRLDVYTPAYWTLTHENIPSTIVEQPSDSAPAADARLLRLTFDLGVAGRSQVIMPSARVTTPLSPSRKTLLQKLQTLSSASHFDLYTNYDAFIAEGLQQVEALLRRRRHKTPQIKLSGFYLGSRDDSIDCWKNEGAFNINNSSCEHLKRERKHNPDEPLPQHKRPYCIAIA
ncbi:hypothetical protein KCU73_g784, partial [Aureobasidium melanogenum]